jgi:hypothetical protein
VDPHFFNKKQAEQHALLLVLQGVWHEFPEMSLGQLLACAVEDQCNDLGLDETLSLKILDDNELADAVLAFGNKYFKGVPNRPITKEYGAVS